MLSLRILLRLSILLAFVKIPIDLSKYKGPVESAATFALGRKVNVTGLSINLLENKQGAVNWSLPAEGKTPVETASQSKPVTSQKQSMDKNKFKLAGDSLVISRLFLKDITVNYQDAKMTSPAQFKIDECNGAMKAGQPFDLTIKGQLPGESYVTAVNIASLEELILKNRSWLTIKTKIANTHFDLSGGIELEKVLKNLQLKISVRGDSLDSLNPMLKTDLPPLKAYIGGGNLLLQKNRVDLTDFTIQVGKSKVYGNMTIDRSGTRSMVNINMNAPLIQLDDFDMGQWSPEKNKPAQKNESSDPDKPIGGTSQIKELFSPEVLEKINIKMEVTADKVFSGKDELGSGNIKFSLKDGRLTLDPVQLDIPGGAFFLAASLRPDPAKPEATLKVVIKNFDFGIWVRHTKPEENMGGIINLDVDLKSTAGRIEDFMKKGSGHFDYSGRLENLKAGIVDLWAVNLIAAALSKEKMNESQINCVIGRWTLKNGLLTPDIFLIDTTKIRICGKGQIDFNKKYIDIKVAPTPKTPEYFNLATPLQIQGSFAKLGVGTQPGGLFGTAIKFLASPVTVSVKKIVTKDLPADGSDVCAIPIGPDNRTIESPEGCK